MVHGYSSRKDQLWHYAVNLIEEELEIRACAGEEGDPGNRIQMKYNQLVSNLSSFGEILAQMYEKKTLTQREFECINKLQSTPIRANEELLNVISRKSRDVYECFLALLIKTGQEHLYQLLVSSHDNQDESDHKDLICRNFTWLSERLDTENELIYLLYQRNVLSISEKEQITCKKGQFQKNVCFLGILSRKSTENFKKFLTALEDTNQSHIVLQLNGMGVHHHLKESCFRMDSRPGEKCKPTERLSSKPISPPKPIVIQPLSKSPIRPGQHQDVTNQHPKVKPCRFQKKFNGMECRLQTEISIKILTLRQRTFNRSDNMHEICIQKILQDNHQLRNDLTNKESQCHEKLEELSKATDELSSATLLSDSLKFECRLLQKELISKKNLNSQNFLQQKHATEKLNKAEDEVFLLKKKYNCLKEEILVKEISMQQLESQLKRKEKQNEKLHKRLHEESQRSPMFEGGKQSMGTQEESLKEINEKFWLISKEKEDLQKACDLLNTENQRLKEVEDIFLRDKEKSNTRQMQVEEDTLILTENEKEHEIITEVLEEDKEKVLSLLLEKQEELEMEKRLRMENEEALQEALNNLEQARRELEDFQNYNKIDATTLGSPMEEESIPTRETLTVRNNYQFLVENIDSSRLINVLHEKNCITDEERDKLSNQPGSFYRNDQLVHLMRAIHFTQDKGLVVLECFRETRQDFIADLLTKEGVVVKCSISSKLVSKFADILSKKSSRERTQTLKEKEDSLILRLNEAQATPSVGSGLRTISELFDNEIEIAPYSRREENGIVIWFWCQSQSSLLRLQGMYVSGVLLERLTILFKQLLSITGSSTPSTTGALVPHAITMQMDQFIRSMEIIDYRKDPVLLLTTMTGGEVPSQLRIFGMTILVDEVFVVNETSPCVEVYDLRSMHFKRSFSIDSLEEPRDIVSCPMKQCLYIVDGGCYAEQNTVMKILRVDANGEILKKLWQGDDWGRLSVTNDFNVLLAVKDKHKLLEITSDGHLLREIKLAVSSPWHAVKLASGDFLISYGNPGGFCIVDTEGKVIISHENYYKELGHTRMVPMKFAVDKAGSVLVADARGDRVFLVTSTLEFQRELVSRKHGLQSPRRILLDDSNCRLLVGENVILGRFGQMSVFDVRGTNVLQESEA